jgi:hypothetical protein
MLREYKRGIAFHIAKKLYMYFWPVAVGVVIGGFSLDALKIVNMTIV